MTNVISLNPFRCRMWSGHDRLDEYINEETCRDEIQSVLTYGQLIPVLCRPLSRDNDHSHELIFGARRLFVARHLNLPLAGEVRDLTDREAVVALDIENRQRSDLSPYERGRAYSSWLRAGLFASQDELARVLNISASQVSRLMRLAQLPTVLVGAFTSATEICETWGRDLMEIWEDPERRCALTAGARAIAQESLTAKLPAATVYQRLVSNAPRKRKSGLHVGQGDHDEVVKDDLGEPLFRIRAHQKDIALLLPAWALSASLLYEIKAQVTTLLQRERRQLHDKSAQSVNPRLLAPAPQAEISRDQFHARRLTTSVADWEQSEIVL
jgi:ParB/RepB/Spo0J family partition protein